MTKVDLISGFLGAGKTTLIQKLLPVVYQNKKVVLVENEFGEIGIDGSFLKEAGIVVNEINSGCICCTLQGDFRQALLKVVDEYHPDIILIEPSGVGKLSDILTLVHSVEGLEVQVQSTVVDANRALVYHRNFGEFFNDQIAHASCVILSRTQEIDHSKLEEVLGLIKEINPQARVVTTNWSDISAETIYDAMTGSNSLVEIAVKELEDHHEHECCGHHHDEEHECCGHHHDEEHECCGHHHDEEHECCGHHSHREEALEQANAGLSEGNKIHIGVEDEHHHHHHHHHGLDADEVFDAIGIETIQEYSREDLEQALSQLPENIIRAKGIVPNSSNEWFFFDYVPGSADIREGKASYTGLITIIGTHIDVEKMKEIFRVH